MNEPIEKNTDPNSWQDASPKTASLYAWTTRDLIVTAVLAVAIGLIYMAYSALYMTLAPLFGQVGIMLLLGFYYLVGIVVPYIVRKPGAALLASFLAAFAELLAGSPFGVMGLAAGLAQGLGAEIGFAFWRWRKYTAGVLIVASMLTSVTAFIYEYFFLEYASLATEVQAGLLFLRMPSAIVLAALLGKALGDALKATGVLRGLAISRKQP